LKSIQIFQPQNVQGGQQGLRISGLKTCGQGQGLLVKMAVPLFSVSVYDNVVSLSLFLRLFPISEGGRKIRLTMEDIFPRQEVMAQIFREIANENHS